MDKYFPDDEAQDTGLGAPQVDETGAFAFPVRPERSSGRLQLCSRPERHAAVKVWHSRANAMPPDGYTASHTANPLQLGKH